MTLYEVDKGRGAGDKTFGVVSSLQHKMNRQRETKGYHFCKSKIEAFSSPSAINIPDVCEDSFISYKYICSSNHPFTSIYNLL